MRRYPFVLVHDRCYEGAAGLRKRMEAGHD